MRCALILAYNGTNFLGSQIQSETSNTILGNLQKVLFELGINSKVVASGRTDKGVHATGQVCHIDLPEFWSDLKKLQRVINQMLPDSILVKKIKKVNDDFHARYSAKKRVYRYMIKESTGNPFENNFVTFLENIDFKKVQKNMNLFIGEHDFKQLMKTGSQVNSTTRTIYKAYAYRHKGFIVLNFEANGFLRSQIRMMVSAVLYLSSKEIQEQINCTKKHNIKPAPSNGLFLAKIKYL